MQKEKPSISLVSESDTVSSFQSRGIRTLRNAKIPSAPAIDLSNNRLSSLQGLNSPEMIKLLQVAHNEITTIEEDPFKKLAVLSYLDLSFNKIEKIQNLFFVSHLHSLNLSNNNIKRLENLEGCDSLRQLNVSDNKITSIYLRSPLTRLVSLDMSGNPLQNLRSISYFTSLSTLIIDRCKLTNPTEIRSLLNLRTFSATKNQITNFPPIFMALLSYADFSFNKLTSLSSFTAFQNLVTLDVSGNPIDDSGLLCDGVFPQMKEFRANSTQISKLSPLASIAPNLVAVSITFSKLNVLDDISNFVANEKSLKYLDIRGNPINIDFYPDINPEIPSDELQEYESEEIYNQAYQNNLDIRTDYRHAVLSAAIGKIAWLDGIRIPGKVSEDVVPPSKMNFLDQNDIEEIPSGCETPVRPEILSERVKQSEQYSMNSDDDDQYNESYECDDEEDSEDDEYIPPPQPRRKRMPHFEGDHPVYESSQNEFEELNSASLIDSEDSGPYEVDHQKQGLVKTANGIYGFVDEPSSDYEDNTRYCAETDAESDFGYTKFTPKSLKKSSAKVPVFDGAQKDIKIGKQGCSFWVPMPQADPRSIPPRISHPKPPQPKEQRYPPFKKPTPQKKSSGETGHYPFNLKTERKLPWEKNTTPSYAVKKTKSVKRVTKKKQ